MEDHVLTWSVILVVDPLKKNVLMVLDERRSNSDLLTKHTRPLYAANCYSVSITYTVPARFIGISKPPTCSYRRAAKSK